MLLDESANAHRNPWNKFRGLCENFSGCHKTEGFCDIILEEGRRERR